MALLVMEEAANIETKSDDILVTATPSLDENMSNI